MMNIYIYMGVGGLYDNEIFEVWRGPDFRIASHPYIGNNPFNSFWVENTKLVKIGKL